VIDSANSQKGSSDGPKTRREDSTARERRIHDLIISRESSLFVEREDDFDELDRYVENDAESLMYLTAPPGRGKTALLATWVSRRRARRLENEHVHARFVGTSRASSSEPSLLTSLMHELRDVHDVTGEDVDDPKSELARWLTCHDPCLDPEGIIRAWGQLLERCGERSRVVIVLDGLERIRKSRYELAWLAVGLPTNVRIIISIGERDAGSELMLKWLQRLSRHRCAGPRPFDRVADRLALARAHFHRGTDERDSELLEALARNEGAREPLFVAAVLAQMRDRETLPLTESEIRREFGVTLKTTARAMLERCEVWTSRSAILRDDTVEALCGMLVCAPDGIPEDILIEALMKDFGAPRTAESELTSAMRMLVDRASPFLLRHDDLYRFGHECFGQVAIDLARSGERKLSRPTSEWHALLASSCRNWQAKSGTSRRFASQHLVYHQLESNARQSALDTLTDFGYHYHRLEEIGRHAVASITIDLSRALQRPVPGVVDARITPWQELYWTRSRTLRSKAPNIPPEEHLLRLALELGSRHPIRQSAEEWLKRTGPSRPWLREIVDPKRIARADERLPLPSDTSPHPDKRTRLVPRNDGRIEVVDTRSGFVLRTLEGHSMMATAIVELSDGKMAISASRDGTLRFWDLESGTGRSAFFAHDGGVLALALEPHGRWAVSSGKDGTLKVWGVEAEERWASWSVPKLVNRCFIIGEHIVARTWDEDLLHLELVTSGPLIRIRSREETRRSVVTGASWHPSRSLLVTMGHDGDVRVFEWHGESAFLEEIARFETEAPMHGGAVSWSTDGRAVQCRAPNGEEREWALDQRDGRDLGFHWSAATEVSANGRWRVEIAGKRVCVMPVEERSDMR